MAPELHFPSPQGVAAKGGQGGGAAVPFHLSSWKEASPQAGPAPPLRSWSCSAVLQALAQSRPGPESRGVQAAPAQQAAPAEQEGPRQRLGCSLCSRLWGSAGAPPPRLSPRSGCTGSRRERRPGLGPHSVRRHRMWEDIGEP